MSQLQDLVTAIAARVNDSTISFESGKVKINRHGQLRRAVFVRPSGVLKFSAAPGRAPFGVPVGSTGTTSFVRFTCQDLVQVIMTAEDEDALEAVFDVIVNALFEVGGPNVLVDAEQTYQWNGDDSVSAGANVNRTPALVFSFKMNRTSHPRLKPYAVVAHVTNAATELNITQASSVPSA